ncbi:MAG: TPM domain-containing protein [Desulfobacteraceae bacterium]|nr:TPM domain-containing protein [Desulfobacteraceae bacterium]
MKISRVIRHLFTPVWVARRYFPARSLKAIEEEIRLAEAAHSGQIRFAVEAALDIHSLLMGKSARERAIEVFSLLRIWDTEHNNGVLIYLLLADHRVEVVADRGVHGHVGASGWEEVCRKMEDAFRQGDFERGAIEGIRSVAAHLTRHFPASGAGGNELPDQPVII